MIQDDKRENEIIQLFGLKQKFDRKRHDADAFLYVNGKKCIFELKSTTVNSVSTASPLTLDHIKKWRTYYWIIGIYNKDNEQLKYCLFASPNMMKPWLDFMEEDINRGVTISNLLVNKIDYPIMYSIFGNKKMYSYKDLKKVFKNLYTPSEYKNLKDLKQGYSKQIVLKMFKQHNLSYLIRGSWLNNPKITRKYYKNFKKINSKQELIKIIKENI